MSAAWSRVFAGNEAQPDPALFEQEALRLAPGASVSFVGDDIGWFRALVSLGDSTPLTIERYGADELGVRKDINSWAAFLEACDYAPEAGKAMEAVALCRQVLTLRRPIDHPDEAALDRLMEGLARHLAQATEGIYQVDGLGFFDASERLLVQEF